MIRMWLTVNNYPQNELIQITNRPKKPDSQKAERVSPQMEREEDVTIFNKDPTRWDLLYPAVLEGGLTTSILPIQHH